MLGTFEALVVAVIALLPGATYTWAFEQRVARAGTNLSDRVWRFAGVSAVFVALALPLLYFVYARLIHTGELRDGASISLWWWTLPPIYVVVPWLVGAWVGRQAHNRAPWVAVITGPAPSPRAWDHFFTTPGLSGWVLLKLKTGGWIVGLWGQEETPGSVVLRSYASGYPDVQELYFADTGNVDADGAVELDEEGRPTLTGLGLLIRWDEVAYAYYAES